MHAQPERRDDAPLAVRRLGMVDYVPTWRAMQSYTNQRTPTSADELWLLEHPPVFTLGHNGKREHLLDTGTIPVVAVDRGGQVTYHGPGQLVAYTLFDLRRLRLGVQSLVRLLEQAVIDLLADCDIRAGRRAGAPGVYVAGRKIAALGLRVRRGCCYHGLSLNVSLDLAPFAQINPCGIRGLEVTCLGALGIDLPVATAGEHLRIRLENLLQNHPHD
jgi:lipoyl(octanoyl) transferase